jgi:O-antigen/teichoic acid export membrane protein
MAFVRKRIAVIAANTASTIALPVYGLLFSVLVIRFCSDLLWGQYVIVTLGVSLGVHLLTWGNKEYLLRSFSLHPAESENNWRKNLFTRCLLLGFIPLVPVVYPVSTDTFLVISIWIVAKFIYQSYEVIVVYQNKFFTTLMIESLSIVIVSAVILTADNIGLKELLYISAGTDLLKALLITLYFRRQFPLKIKGATIDLKIFVRALPFFLLGFTGLLQSRMDQLCVNYYLSGKEIARYQVFVNFLLYLQAGSGFILIPFVKNIYRLPLAILKKLAARLFAASLLLVPVGIGAVYVAITCLYKLQLSLLQYSIGALFALPIFYYSPLIHYLFRQGRQNTVLVVVVSGIVLNLAAALFLIPQYGITGALVGAMFSQWMMMLFFYCNLIYRKI